MARYKSKGIRGNWSEASMKQALTAIKSGKMKIYTASKHYNVPRRTLRRYLLEKKETKSTLGRKPLLNPEQEKILASRIIRLCNVGYPLTQRVLRTCVKTFCDRNNISASDGDSMVGRDWLRGFLKRHKNISKRKAQKTNKQNKRGHLLPNTANRSNNNSKHPTQVDRVYDDFDSSEEIPLSKLKQHKNNRDSKTESKVCSTTLNESYSSFCEILKTPEKTSSPKTKTRAKAINSLAQELTKSMFTEKNNKPGPSNASKQKIENKPGPSRASSQKRKQYSTKMNKTEAVTSKVNQKGKGHTKKSKNSWYCYVCDEDRIADMRICFLCQTYVHEDCVGLTKEDTDKFICTRCSQD